MDVYIAKYISLHSFTTCVSQQLPPGMEIIQAYQMATTLPSLQAQVRYAEYEVEVETEKEPEDTETALNSLLSLKHLPWQHQRDTGTRYYDLRYLIDDLWLIYRHHPYCTVGMRLRSDNSGSGRPEQVTAALGFTHHPQSIHRTKLILRTS